MQHSANCTKFISVFITCFRIHSLELILHSSVGYLEIDLYFETRPVSRSQSDLDLVIDLEGVGLGVDLELGTSVLGIFTPDQLEINFVIM